MSFSRSMCISMLLVGSSMILAGCIKSWTINPDIQELPTSSGQLSRPTMKDNTNKSGMISRIDVYQIILDGTETNYSWTKTTVGCNDSLVSLPTTVSINEVDKYAGIWNIFSKLDREPDGFTNPWKTQNKLSFQSYEIQGSTLIINLSWQIMIGGVCDVPRLNETIKATYKTLWYTQVLVLVNGQPIQ